MIMTVVPLQVSHGQGNYTEKLNVFVSGSDALWYFTFGGINNATSLSTLDSTPGLNGYNLTAIKTTTWSPDFQAFGPGGYNLIPVPSVQTQGMFLNVSAHTFNDASTAASALDSYLLTHFMSLSNGSSTFSFYSPITFDAIMPSTLLLLVPKSEGGFANAISSTAFTSTSSPFVVLEGRQEGGTFSHTLIVGSISSSALDSSGRPNILQYFGTTVTSLEASKNSSSSVVQLSFLDAAIVSSDKGASVNSSPQRSSTYTLKLGSGAKVFGVNATVVEQPAILLASRDVSKGVLSTGDNVTVTVNLTNLSPSLQVNHINFTDDWWTRTGEFKLVGGNDTANPAGLAAAASKPAVYRLQYTGTTTGSITIPASVVRYSYLVSGVTFNATAVLNPIRLSLGTDDAVVYAKVEPIGTMGKPVGQREGFNVTVINVGNQPASTVFVAGHSVGALAVKSAGSSGESSWVTVNEGAVGLVGINFTKSFPVTYQDQAGHTLDATTNVAYYVFSHVSMSVGYAVLNVAAGVSALSGQVNNVTLTFSTFNLGPANITSFVASSVLPSGLGCGLVSGTGLTCSGGKITISYPLMNASSNLNAYMRYNFTTPASYILGAMHFSGSTAGMNFTGESSAAAIPGGLVLSKVFSPAQLFQGMVSHVTVEAMNAGSLPFYTLTVRTTIDNFDTLTTSTALSGGPVNLDPGKNLTFTYSVAASPVSGSENATKATATFYFGGEFFSVNGAGGVVQVHQPLTVTIDTTPASPEEGKSFSVGIHIVNPSGLDVTNVVFELPIPAGVSLSGLVNATVSGGTLTVSANDLPAHSSLRANATVVASSGITIPFDKAKLTFAYGGVAVNGVVPSSSGIAVGENITTRYLIPILGVLVVLLLTAVYLRRKAAPTVPSSQK